VPSKIITFKNAIEQGEIGKIDKLFNAVTKSKSAYGIKNLMLEEALNQGLTFAKAEESSKKEMAVKLLQLVTDNIKNNTNEIGTLFQKNFQTKSDLEEKIRSIQESFSQPEVDIE